MFLVVTDNCAVAHQETPTDSHLMSSWWLARNAAYLRDAILAATDCGILSDGRWLWGQSRRST
jgi:hypothetical protein